MIEKIREKFFPLCGRNAARKLPGAFLRGNAHHIIVVKAPNEIFTEAIFILRDDYFLNADESAEELLRQAKMAAREYIMDNKQLKN